MEILAEQDKVKIIARASFFTKTMVLPLDRPYEEEYEGIKMNVRFIVRPQSTKKADNKIRSAIFSKTFSSNCIILKIQRLEGKHCRSR